MTVVSVLVRFLIHEEMRCQLRVLHRVVEQQREGTAAQKQCRGNVKEFAAVHEVSDGIALRLQCDNQVRIE